MLYMTLRVRWSSVCEEKPAVLFLYACALEASQCFTPAATFITSNFHQSKPCLLLVLASMATS